MNLHGADCDQDTNRCIHDQQAGRKYYVRGDVNQMKLILVNASSMVQNHESFNEQFGGVTLRRFTVAGEPEILYQISVCMAWVLLCIITVYMSSVFATHMDGRLFVDKKPDSAEKKIKKMERQYFFTMKNNTSQQDTDVSEDEGRLLD